MKLLNDFLVDAKNQLSNLADQGLPILIYNGDKDYICNWEGSEYLVDNLPWKNQKEFWIQPYHFYSHGKLKSYQNLFFYVIYEAGHMVPMD